jgi:hypothetical protein
LFSRARNLLPADRDVELLRSELFSIEQLKRHAITLAEQHSIEPHPGPDRLLPRLADNEHVLIAAYDVVTTVALSGQRIAPAEAWLLDNFYLNCRAWWMGDPAELLASTIWRWS